MAGKQYEVVRPFKRVDPETGDVTEYAPGDSYTGPMENEEHYIGNDGPDNKGPLVRATSEQPPTGASTSGDSSKGGK